MQEIEKRCGLNATQSKKLISKLNQKYSVNKVVHRTILIKVEGKNFTADPDEMIDIKIKLIDNETILAVKYGSWHNATSRQEYEINFERSDLANLISFLQVLSYNTYILLSTKRTIWQSDKLTITLDEYQGLDRSLFEVETNGHDDEAQIDAEFKALGVTPMDSQDTIAFINSLNSVKEAQIDLAKTSPTIVASRMIELHT